MKKNVKLSLIAVVILAVYIAVILLVPFNHVTNFWVAFGLSVFEYLMSAGMIIYIAGFSKKTLPLYNIASIRRSCIFCAFALILNVAVIMVIESCPLWLVMVLNIIITAVYILMMTASSLMKDSELVREKEKRQKVNAFKGICIKVEGLEVGTDNDDLKSKLGKLIEILKYSDPISPEEVKSTDEKIHSNVELLEKLITSEKNEDALSCCDDIMRLLQERNKICKLYK